MEDPHTIIQVGKFYKHNPALYTEVMKIEKSPSIGTLIRVMNNSVLFTKFASSTDQKFTYAHPYDLKTNHVVLRLHDLGLTGIYETFAGCSMFLNDLADIPLRKVILQDVENTYVFLYSNAEITKRVVDLLNQYSDQDLDAKSAMIDFDACKVSVGARILFELVIFDAEKYGRASEEDFNRYESEEDEALDSTLTWWGDFIVYIICGVIFHFLFKGAFALIGIPYDEHRYWRAVIIGLLVGLLVVLLKHLITYTRRGV